MKILLVMAAYLFGAIPTGFILFRLSERKDIRGFGSRSTGATNVMRLKGWRYAVPVLIFDLLKGFLPVFLALRIFSDFRLALVASFMAVLGHCFPVYIGFRGGKGVAATVGAFAAIAVTPFLFSVALFLLIVVLTRYVSLASIAATLFFPAFVALFHGRAETILWGLAIAALVIVKHQSNIRRLLRHEERKFGERAG